MYWRKLGRQIPARPIDADGAGEVDWEKGTPGKTGRFDPGPYFICHNHITDPGARDSRHVGTAAFKLETTCHPWQMCRHAVHENAAVIAPRTRPRNSVVRRPHSHCYRLANDLPF